MVPHYHHPKFCDVVERLLRKLAGLRGHGRISEALFVRLLLKLEAERLEPAGFVLTASNTLDDWTVVKVREKGDPEPCAAVEFLPQTGEFREVGHGPFAEAA